MNSSEWRRPSRDESIEATAAAWLAQRDGGFTPAEAAEFDRWRQADPRHAAVVARLEGAWAALQQLRNYRLETAYHPDPDLLRSRFRRKTFRLQGLLAPLALAAALAMAAVWWWPRDLAPGAVSSAETLSYKTTVGGYERTTLPDGSVMELNASTEVRVNYSPSARRVELLRGEAHFTVAKNKERPFWVEIGKVSVRAVGTAFNVRFEAQNVEVLVTEGKVRVQSGDKVDVVEGPMASLTAGQRLVLSTAIAPLAELQTKVQSLTPDVIREELVWQGPRLVFADTPLSNVIAQFNRINQVQLELGDAELEKLVIGGSFRAENVEAFVRLLASDNSIVVERPEPDRIVLRKAK